LLALAAIAVPASHTQVRAPAPSAKTPLQQIHRPPRVLQAERFLAQRGWKKGQAQAWEGAAHLRGRAISAAAQPRSQGQPQSTTSWQELGPLAVQSINIGPVSGRVSSLALDPSDPTGNVLYVGTTGGGVWRSSNAGTSNVANIAFLPLTDTLSSLSDLRDASISIGALSVQPGGICSSTGGTGAILAGTGDPNDALDSYYGAGILRYALVNGVCTWQLVQSTSDVEDNLGAQDYSFLGEGFAGFAWSTDKPQFVVAAVSQAYEGTLVNAVWPTLSYEGLYYSADSGATWHLATITDGNGMDVQGPLDAFASPDGNAATSVVWNRVRHLFVAAVRFHGYYQSTDGVTWTRMAAQPGANLNLTAGLCPTNPGSTGSPACPIFRGTLAVNPMTGDTFAWTVDGYNQDQGLWMDQCGASAGTCGNQTIKFAQQLNSAALETGTQSESATILDGDYTLALAAVPSGQETLLLAGADDLWSCSVTDSASPGCTWRNTTNTAQPRCSAQVGEYQHALAWNPANPQEIFIGNDSGLWRSSDGIAETGSVCSTSDASHFQNLNGGLGSLAEVESISQVGATPYTMMAGLGENGTAGVKSGSTQETVWPEILGGEGGPVQIDPGNNANWYMNNQAGVSIHLCSQQSPCTPDSFGDSPVVNDADVDGDGLTMTTPAPFLVDPLDRTQLLIGTCRVWRGPAGSAWSSGNVLSPILDGTGGNSSCNGDALIRSMAAIALSGGKEVIYVGMFGSADGGATLPGHVLSATIDSSSSTVPVWTDLTLNPVSGDSLPMNAFGMDISSIFIDSHDATGNTVYVTVEGIESPSEEVRTVYRSIDGGAHWASIMSNLPVAPANSLVVDPLDPNTVYVATDDGVYSTQSIASCAQASGSAPTSCWSALGSGLPYAPVTELSASPASSSVKVLVAATYGRGIWMTPLLTASEGSTTVTASPASLTFGSQAVGTTSSAQTVVLTNTGANPLLITSITTSGDFAETDSETAKCLGQTVMSGASCSMEVTFAPTQTGSRTGVVTIGGNLTGGDVTVALSGTGTPPGVVTISPTTLDFGAWPVNSTSSNLQVTVENTGTVAVPITGVTVTAPFVLASSTCTGSLAPPSTSPTAPPAACQMEVAFAPTQAGAATGTLTFTDSSNTLTVALSGSGQSLPTDNLSPSSLTFSGTVDGQLSAAQVITLTNNGDLPLEGISIPPLSGVFQTTNKCTTQLPAHSSCDIGVVFAPVQPGNQTGTLTITDALRTQTVALSGIGLLPPAFGVSPSSLTFAAQTVGQASTAQTLTVSNTGGAPMANIGFAITGQSASEFSCGSSICNATNCGATLANGASCTVQVIFTPSTAGGETAALVISSSSPGVAAASVPLTGAGQSSTGLSVQPAQLSFSVVAPGQSSAAQTVTVTNSGKAAANSLSLLATAPFALVNNTCSASLGAGASCTVGVVFSPAVNGSFTGTLTVASSLQSAPTTVPLSGTGGTPGSVLVEPTFLNFPQTGVGTVGSPQTITITNSVGTGSLSGFSLAVSTGFRLVNNTCPSTLAPQASCTAGVEFAPTSAGALTGTLTVIDSQMAAGQTVPLTGAGFDFTIAVSGSSSQTVANGQTASYTLAIALLNQTQGAAVSLSCGTASFPAYAACAFNPSANPQIPATASGSVTVQILTGQTTSSASAVRPSGWRLLPLACGFLLLPLALGRRRRLLMMVAVLAILVSGVSSCTSSGGMLNGGTPKSGSGITPAGTYTITVNALSNGVTHPVTFTLTVD
jgi:hypothetical protein